MNKVRSKDTTVSVHVRIPNDVHGELLELAAVEMRTMGGMLKVLVAEALSARKANMRKEAA